MHKRDRWNSAEDVAATWLTAKGMRICARNRTMRGGELDIVGYLDDLLVIIEVRSIDHIDDLQNYVSSLKVNHLIRSAQHRIHIHHWSWPLRIDVIYVKWTEVVERFQNITNT